MEYTVETIANSWIDGSKRQAYRQWKDSEIDPYELDAEAVEYLTFGEYTRLLIFFLDQEVNRTNS